MVKLSILLLQIILAASVVLAKSVYSDEELTYIGSFKSEKGSTKNVIQKQYFISSTTATWSNADADCRSRTGGSLVGIEDDDEWEFLNIQLENHQFDVTYWTSGIYDPAREYWIWTATNDAIPTSFMLRFPSDPQQIERVLLHHLGRYDSFMWTFPSAQTHRYICQQP